eukprot:1151185-Prorocentrum_lima.AAC.1
MTSSLVGSEMCIRDRAKDCAKHLSYDHQGGQAAPPFLRKGDTVPWSVPVSYTHLTLPTICSV